MFAAEHGKGECDGDCAVLKNRVRYLFKQGRLIMSLEDLCVELRNSISVMSSSKQYAHSIDARRFIAVNGMLISIAHIPFAIYVFYIHILATTPFLLCPSHAAGTFPISTTKVLGSPPIRPFHSFLALANPPPECHDHIFYRTISCACGPCLMGSLVGCDDARHVPLWRSQRLTFRPKRALITQAANAARVRRALILYKSRIIK